MVAGAYAKALLQMTEQTGEAEMIYDACLTIEKALEQVPEYAKILSSPAMGSEEKKELLGKWLEGTPKLLQNTCYLLCDKRQAALLPNILREYIEKYRRNNSIALVNVTSAIALSDKTREQLRDALSEATGKEILLRCRVSPDCMGGLKLEIDGKQYDGSVRGRIARIREQMSIFQGEVRRNEIKC